MKFEAERTYPVTIDEVKFFDHQDGIPRLQFMVSHPDCGYLYKTFKINADSKARIVKLLDELGVSAAEIKTLFTTDHEAPNRRLAGLPASIVTESDTYKDKESIKVKWLNGRRSYKAPSPDSLARVSALFDDMPDSDEPSVPF